MTILSGQPILDTSAIDVGSTLYAQFDAPGIPQYNVFGQILIPDLNTAFRILWCKLSAGRISLNDAFGQRVRADANQLALADRLDIIWLYGNSIQIINQDPVITSCYGTIAYQQISRP